MTLGTCGVPSDVGGVRPTAAGRPDSGCSILKGKGCRVTAQIQDASVSVEVAVRFAETDLMGVVHHSAYIVWMEMGRIAWMDERGMPYTEIAAGGHHFAVTGIEAQYRSSLRFGDRARIITRLVHLRSRQVSFEYEIHHGATGELAARGVSHHICVDLDGRMARIPADVLERLALGKGIDP